MPKTKKFAISLAPKVQEKGKKNSVEMFGYENLSGYISALILEADRREEK